MRFHQEQVQSAKDRYANEMKRIIRVFNDALEGREYLVGDKVTMADIGELEMARYLRDCMANEWVPPTACIPWNGMIEVSQIPIVTSRSEPTHPVFCSTPSRTSMSSISRRKCRISILGTRD